MTAITVRPPEWNPQRHGSVTKFILKTHVTPYYLRLSSSDTLFNGAMFTFSP